MNIVINITRDQNTGKFHFYISENLLEYTLKQEYNKIEYTSNVEYTNYYSSNLNTGTFPLKLQLKKKKEERKLQVLELPDKNHAEP